MEGPAGEFSVRQDASAKRPQAAGAASTSAAAASTSGMPRNWNSNLVEARSDDELAQVLEEAKAKRRPVVVSYGATWCHACKKMLPTFFNLSNEYERPIFVYADVDRCSNAADDVRYTPTFRFFRDGNKVDEFYGAGQQRLRDRVWLQS